MNKKITAHTNYERIILIRNDILWIKNLMYLALSGISINIVVNLIKS